jgi:RNA polymerase sigma-70 factor (ECF subfamily)
VDLEEQIRRFRDTGDLNGAATRALEGYGPELFGFLMILLRNEHDASEVFSQTCEDLWVGLGRFEARCSMRTWLYALARHAAARFRRSPHRRPGRHVTPSELCDVVERVRTQTQRYLRTEVKNQFAAIRDSLDEDDRALLILRVDRQMSWGEIARVFSADLVDDRALNREAARLRKHFQSVKSRVRSLAHKAGLLPSEEPRPSSKPNRPPLQSPASDGGPSRD